MALPCCLGALWKTSETLRTLATETVWESLLCTLNQNSLLLILNSFQWTLLCFLFFLISFPLEVIIKQFTMVLDPRS